VNVELAPRNGLVVTKLPSPRQLRNNPVDLRSEQSLGVRDRFCYLADVLVLQRQLGPGTLAVADNLLRLGAQCLAKIVALVRAMDSLNGLFKADGDKKTNTDGRDVDEEVFPAVRGVMRGMDVKHSA
jgi:hypothetical protein